MLVSRKGKIERFVHFSVWLLVLIVHLYCTTRLQFFLNISLFPSVWRQRHPCALCKTFECSHPCIDTEVPSSGFLLTVFFSLLRDWLMCSDHTPFIAERHALHVECVVDPKVVVTVAHVCCGTSLNSRLCYPYLLTRKRVESG